MSSYYNNGAPPPPPPPPRPSEFGVPPPVPEALRHWDRGQTPDRGFPIPALTFELLLWLGVGALGFVFLVSLVWNIASMEERSALPTLSAEALLKPSVLALGLQGAGVAFGLLAWVRLLERWWRRRGDAAAGAWCDPDATVVPVRDMAKVLLLSLLIPLFVYGIVLSWLPSPAAPWDMPLILALSLAGGPYAWWLWRRRGGSARVWLGGTGGWRETLATAGQAFLLWFPVALLADALFGGDELQEIGVWVALYAKRAPALTIAVALLTTLAVPVAEELMFRLLFRGVLRRWGSGWWLCALNGLLFAVLHFQPIHIVSLFLMGVYWSWWRERTRGLAVPILLHAFNNGYALVMLLLCL